MQLTLWTYEGPPHVGAMRIATAMQRPALRAARAAGRHLRRSAVHDDRAPRRAPAGDLHDVQARDLGSDTAELFKTAVREAYERFKPAGDDRRLLLHRRTASRTIPAASPRARPADPGHAAGAAGLSEERELGRGARRSISSCAPRRPAPRRASRGARPRCNLLGPTALGFRHRDDVREITALLERLGVEVNVVAPLGASPPISRGSARPISTSCSIPRSRCPRRNGWRRTIGQPFTKTVPIGVGATRDFIDEVAALAGRRSAPRRSTTNVALALVLALGQFDLSDRQARLHLRRRDARDRRRAHRARRTRLQRRRARDLFARIRARGARARPRPTASRR